MRISDWSSDVCSSDLQPGAVVAVGREPFVIVLDDHQFAVADQARTRIHHHPARGRAHRLAAGPGDVDALPGRVARAVGADELPLGGPTPARSEEHTSELQSLMRISYAVFCLKKKKQQKLNITYPND